jgi:hypothetical protein
MSKRITPKQENFAIHYALTGNATEAYRKAYNSKPSTKPETIHSNASQLLNNTQVAQRIEELRAKTRKVAEKKFEVTKEAILGNVLLDVQDIEATIAEVEKPENKFSGFNSKLANYKYLSALSGLDPDTKGKLELTGKDGGPLEINNKGTNYDIAREIAFLLAGPEYQVLLTNNITEIEHGNDEQPID